MEPFAIKANNEPHLYYVRTYHIPIHTLRGQFPIKYNFFARAGMIGGFHETNSGINVFIRHHHRFGEDIEYKFLFALDNQKIPPAVNDFYWYMGSINKDGGYIHLFGLNGDGELYP